MEKELDVKSKSDEKKDYSSMFELAAKKYKPIEEMLHNLNVDRPIQNFLNASRS
jgi:hypothetical protein